MRPYNADLTPLPGTAMRHRLRSIAFLSLCLSATAEAQLYGITPYQNGPLPQNGALYLYDPDTLTWLDGIWVQGNPSSIVNGRALAVHPTLPPPNDALNGRLYAVLRMSGFTNLWLMTVDPVSGATTPIGELGDKFDSIAFAEDGRLFGVTADDASVPETLYQIDKLTGAQTPLATLGNGGDGELIAYNPEVQQLYHWSGAAVVTLERIRTDLYLTTNIPITGSTRGETVGAVWDPCRPRTVAATTALGFIGTNAGLTLDYWRSSGEIGAAPGSQPDASRGLALIGGYRCDADLRVSLGSPNPAPAPGSPITLTVQLSNAGQARAMTPVLTITAPANLGGLSTSGCLEDPAGIPSCTPRILTPRYDVPSAQYQPFQLASLWRDRTVTITLQGSYTGGASTLDVSASSASNELQSADNQASLRLGDSLLQTGFED